MDANTAFVYWVVGFWGVVAQAHMRHQLEYFRQVNRALSAHHTALVFTIPQWRIEMRRLITHPHEHLAPVVDLQRYRRAA
jgi:hypothetical protein